MNKEKLHRVDIIYLGSERECFYPSLDSARSYVASMLRNDPAAEITFYGVWESNREAYISCSPEQYLLGPDPTITAPEPDMVNHPPHYTQHPKGIECIDVIEDNPFSNLSAAMKYIWRVSWGSKGRDVEDLEKAVWYVQREIKRRQKKA